MNTGIVLAQTPYITLANDDIEFINSSWFQGVLETFKMDANIIGVNPNSPKEGAFGYGLTMENKDHWQPGKDSGFIRDPQDDMCVLPKWPGDNVPFTLDHAKTDRGYDFLLNNHPHWQKGTLNDAVAMWCTVFTRDGLLNQLGLIDEQFYPGGGEDYDMNCRAYSCGWPERRNECNPSKHRRMVGTTKSWVWHHWGKSKELFVKNVEKPMFQSRPRWNANDEIWEGGFDVWGHIDYKGKKVPLNRARSIHIENL
jgi:hypothetical protein